MDVLSYLLGKQSGGGSGGNYSISMDGSLTYYTTYGLKSLINDIKSFDTTGMTSFESFFAGCSGITTVPALDTTNITSLANCFTSCVSLISMPLWDTKNVTHMTSCFYGCTNLKDVPVLDTSVLYGAGGMFNGCNSLTDESLDNILQMCINATVFGGTKTLYALGFRKTKYPQSKLESLPHWADFVAAGWESGY